jgi:hypothetical protein
MAVMPPQEMIQVFGNLRRDVCFAALLTDIGWHVPDDDQLLPTPCKPKSNRPGYLFLPGGCFLSQID